MERIGDPVGQELNRRNMAEAAAGKRQTKAEVAIDSDDSVQSAEGWSRRFPDYNSGDEEDEIDMAWDLRNSLGKRALIEEGGKLNFDVEKEIMCHESKKENL
ncbi:hypothetical protein OROMI_015122 [Orobanche minor]